MDIRTDLPSRHGHRTDHSGEAGISGERRGEVGMPGSLEDAVQTGPPSQISDTDPFAVPMCSSHNQDRRSPEQRTAWPRFPLSAYSVSGTGSV